MTARLHPRLVRRFAHQVLAEQSEQDLHALRSAASTTHDLETWPAVGAQRVDTDGLDQLASALRSVADAHGWPSRLADDDALQAVDLAFARALHEAPSLCPAEAAAGDWWSFAALVLVPDVVRWRAGTSTNPERYVGADLTRHALARLWWRAHYFTYGLDDPEEGWTLLATMREADVDQLMTRRTSLGSNPIVTRAVAATFPLFDEIAGDRPETRRDLWRQVYLAWLLRIGEWWSFESLPEAELRAEMLAIVRERLASLPR